MLPFESITCQERNLNLKLSDVAPMPTVTALSIVIPTRNRRPRLPSVLAPLLADTAVTAIVVVVDGSDDGSAECLLAVAANEPRLLPIVHAKSLGAQIARADGLTVTSGEIVLFLDDDVVAGPRLAAGYLQRHQEHAGLVVVGYLPSSLQPPRRRGQFASYLYSEEYEGRYDAFEKDLDEILRTLWWGNVSMRRVDAMDVGLVAPRVEAAYHEDQEFGLRCLEAGLFGVFDHSLVAEPHHHRDLRGFTRDARAPGVAQVLLHSRHRELTGPFEADVYESNLAIPFAALVRAAQFDIAAAVLIRSLQFSIRVAGLFRHFKEETYLARLLRRIAQRSGASSPRRYSTREMGQTTLRHG